jgi:GDP/UDP-N,N'-diacetylbacillosamine 2-epimerase (hydrolysing)
LKKILYVTGTRADFGLMEKTLKAIDNSTDFNLGIVVTGSHFDEEGNYSFQCVLSSELKILAEIRPKVPQSQLDSWLSMGSDLMSGLKAVFRSFKPDLVIVLGDRFEMLITAISAVSCLIPVVHIHGGELSGTLDESFRHAISKLANIHLVSTAASAERLIRMGENRSSVFVVGAPGLEGIETIESAEDDDLREIGLDPKENFSVIIFHPVVQRHREAKNQVRLVYDVSKVATGQLLVVAPNDDLGARQILEFWEEIALTAKDNVVVKRHIDRQLFLSILKRAELLLGNSSMGIIESASLNLPTINFGSRQAYRERNQNCWDTDFDTNDAVTCIGEALQCKSSNWSNVYYQPNSSSLILKILTKLDFSSLNLEKCNAY